MNTLPKRHLALPLRGATLLSLVAVAAVTAAGYAIIKTALDTVSPLAFVGWRFMFAATTLALLSVPRGARLWKDSFVAGLVLYAAIALQTAGLAATTVSHSALITATAVVLFPVLSAGFAQGSQRWLLISAVVASAAGLSLLSSGGDAFGNVLTFGAAISFAGYWIIVNQSRQRVVPYMAAQCAVVAALGLLTSTMFEDSTIPEPVDLPAIAVVGVVVTAGTFLVHTWARTRTTGKQAAGVFLLEPALAALVAIAAFGDRLGATGWTAMLLIVGSGMVIVSQAMFVD